MPAALPPRPLDATLSVTKAARLLGVHPNTVRAWSDAGRLRYYRINPRGDRRYRLGDLQRFMAAAESGSLALDVGGGGLAARRRPERGGRPNLTLVAAGGTERRAGDEPGRSDGLSEGGRSIYLLADLTGIAATARDTDSAMALAVRAIRDRGRHHAVIAFQLTADRLVPRGIAAAATDRIVELPREFRLVGNALDAPDGEPIVADPPHTVLAGGYREVAVAIPGPRDRPWGVLLVADDRNGPVAAGAADREYQSIVASAVGAIASAAATAEHIAEQLHRADALRRVASEIGSRLDLGQILSGLVDHAIVLFGGDRGAVFLRTPEGPAVAQVSRGLSSAYLQSVRDFPARSLPAMAVAARRPMYASGYASDPRGIDVRAAVVQEGFDTICTAPLLDGNDLLGLLNVYHDLPRPWRQDELDTLAALAAQAVIAIKNAQNYEQMATWAAQLQSIQQLGTRLSRLTSVSEVGLAIANELRQLIDYHNVRVYRLMGDELIPVAMRGQVGEYVDETPDQLKVRVGEGITGWVAEHRVAQNLPDAVADPRASTIPGTEDDLDESMLLAPMLFEDDVLGVLVLSKLGLHQFSDDDLRLLVIYASFAAQAFANAETTERLKANSEALERQLAGQRELLEITESILTTLDPRAILDQVSDRLSDLVGYDNLSIEILDRTMNMLRPLTAKGIHAEQYMEPWLPGEEGLATWVVSHNEPVLVVDERDDGRVLHFRDSGPLEGSLICVPLRGRDGAAGVLTLERLGTDQPYSEEEFELVKLFAAQVSIALQNAEVHRAVEIRAQTDDLTGLLNHGTFQEWLLRSVANHEPFSLIMLDLDDFKAVNDAFGHQAGDRLLAEIGRAIVAAGRETDRVFRYGGDEFALLLPGTDETAAMAVAKRVRKAVEAIGGPGSAWHGAEQRVKVSIGLATHPRDGMSAEAVLLAADRACFLAKRSGGGLIKSADEGLSLAREFSLQAPTPVDPPTLPLTG